MTVLHKAQFSLLLLLVFCPQVVASVDLSQTSLLPANCHSHPAGLLFLQESFHVLAFIRQKAHPQYNNKDLFHYKNTPVNCIVESSDNIQSTVILERSD